jgi:hypothetical protein
MSSTYQYFGPGVGVAHSYREIDVMIALRRRILMVVEGIRGDDNDNVVDIESRSNDRSRVSSRESINSRDSVNGYESSSLQEKGKKIKRKLIKLKRKHR